ncbi:hypothetical protein D7B24_008302 [Verticillium nonalfalfae]|uniref:Uncharacterized protein n=1 Tax=Verticillium nonalfalfae TaxID=1051616 RepID=A0A3M9Y9E4_9PEZI|nr:uncharacterized protein D7B24_008302 [Verticillium nonalfalfae]RNJ55680.1 hypothetical protein D7B24_008302 [Verticillium nonalfalfae]
MATVSQPVEARAAATRDPLSLEPLDTDDTTGEDGLIDDDAQLVMQPALSVAATRLTLSRTPAAEKAAAMDMAPENPYFTSVTPPTSDEESTSPGSLPVPISIQHDRPARASSRRASPPRTYHEQRYSPPPQSPLPTPWRSVPNETNASPSGQPKRALESISFGQTRARRSGSAGAEAFKRLSKALPSFPNASSLSNIMSNMSNSFFSSSPTEKTDSTPGIPRSPPLSQGAPRTARPSRPHNNAISYPANRSQPGLVHDGSADERVQSPLYRKASNAHSLRRTNSDDSILYHSLSRVSSLGDETMFDDVREMANVRMKAIRDSLPDRPSFKMPSMPKFASQRKMFQAFDEPSIAPIPELPAFSQEDDDAAALDRVLETLTGDLVILGGYRGSVLRSAEAPHHQLWAPVKVGLNLRKADLEVGLDPEDEETMEQRIIPSGMLQNIGPIDISRKLFKKVRSCENARNGKLRIWDYGYDWRLSPHLLSQKMIAFLEKLPSNLPGSQEPRGALVVAHSLGGLITRHVVNQRPDLFSGVVYVGVPQRCINVLGPLRNGDAVLFNEKILTAQVNFSLRTTFAFLPEDGFCFIDKDTKEEYRIDFHSADDWVKYRLCPATDTALPALNPKPATGFGSILRNRSSSYSEKRYSQHLSNSVGDMTRNAEFTRDRLLNPQVDSTAPKLPPPDTRSSPFGAGSDSIPPPTLNRARNIAYLKRTLAEVKHFRAELAHKPAFSEANVYPPIALMYGKDTPTVYAVKVAGRDAIAHADCYDDLVFRPGDGVVLAREAQLPEGYELVRGGRQRTHRGHLTMLGDMPAVGRAMEAVIRGRRKGIGMGRPDTGHNGAESSAGA